MIAPRLANGAVRLLVLLTKADKLNRSAAGQALRSAQDMLAAICPEHADVGVGLFSALKSTGIGDAAIGAARLGAAACAGAALRISDDVVALEVGQGHAQVFAQVRETARSSIRWRRWAARPGAWGCRR